MYLVLGKRRIFKNLTLLMGILIIFTILYIDSKKEKETISTSNINDKKKIVVLDAGHGQPDRTEP